MEMVSICPVLKLAMTVWAISESGVLFDVLLIQTIVWFVLDCLILFLDSLLSIINIAIRIPLFSKTLISSWIGKLWLLLI